MVHRVNVETTEVPGTQDQVDLTVAIKEKPTGNLLIGAGFSSADKLSFTASIKQENVFGSGNYLGLELNTSRSQRTLVLSTVDPYFTIDGISRAVDLYYRTVKPLNNPFYTIGKLATAKKYQYFKKFNYAPAKAIALLKKHGCTGGPSSTFVCQGHKAEINFYTTTAPARCAVSMPGWVQQEAAIGIKLDTHCYTAQPDFFTNLLPTGNFDLAEYAFTGSPDPSGWDAIYQCVGKTTGGQNYKNYCNKKVDKLIRLGDKELNPKKRTADYEAAARLVSTNVAIIPLYARPSFLFYNHKIQGMGTSNNPTSEGPTWNVEQWHW